MRSITMDKWNEEQMKKMRAGGNKKFEEFMESYGEEQGGYRKVPKMEIKEKYNTWAAKEYREKVSVPTVLGKRRDIRRGARNIVC